MSYRLRDKEPLTLYQAFVTAMDIENNLRYGLTRSHFSKAAYLYNEDINQRQYNVECSNSVQNVDTLIVMNSQIEILD